MLSFAKTREKDTGVVARVVSNDLFRHHERRYSRDWIKEHTVQYVFVSWHFVPGSLAVVLSWSRATVNSLSK